MTFERALNVDKEPQNWLLHHGNYQGHRFSALKEINTDTVKNLKLAFTVALGGFEGGGTRYKFGNLEATPIVEDGVMYVPDGWGSVYAIDVSSGKKGTFRWKFDPGTDKAWAGDVACCGVNNRGVALWKDKVISISLDGRMFALNKATGEKVWERKIADPAHRRDADPGAAGRARRGDRRRRRRRIRHPRLYRRHRPQHRQAALAHLHDPGQGRARQRDLEGRQGPLAARRRLGVGDRHLRPPTPTRSTRASAMPVRTGIREYRPGDNKWAASVLALNPANGQIKWGFQYTPNDPYDFDEISEHPIINAKVNGEDRKLVVHAARNGFFYALDRTNGSFVAGKQYVDELNWTPGLDPKTGKPLNYDPTKDVQVYAPGSHGSRAKPDGETLPVALRRQELGALAYNPELNLLYIPSIEGCNSLVHGGAEGHGGPGRHREAARAVRRRRQQESDRLYGSLKAVDPTTGEIKAAAGSNIRTSAARWRPPATWSSSASRRLVHGPRRPDPAGGLELQCRHRHQCAAGHLFGQRQAVCRGPGRLEAAA